MAAAIRRNYEAGKGVYLMKIFGGGTLLDEFQACLDYVRREVPYHAVAVGMVAAAEVDYNLACLTGGARPDIDPIRQGQTGPGLVHPLPGMRDLSCRLPQRGHLHGRRQGVH